MLIWFLSTRCRYLTNCLQSVDRFPMSFRSTFHGSVYRHIVLGLHTAGRYGAIGLSRRDDLMYRPLKYTVSHLMSLAEMCNYMNTVWNKRNRPRKGSEDTTRPTKALKVAVSTTHLYNVSKKVADFQKWYKNVRMACCISSLWCLSFSAKISSNSSPSVLSR